jgi:hypothetical protein
VRLLKRGTQIVLALAMLVIVPATSEAMAFSFAGTNDSGMFAWDGDADVSTMNNFACGGNFPPDPALCATSIFDGSLADLRIFVTNASGSDFTRLSVLFRLPGDCDPFGGPSATCQSLSQVLSGLGNPPYPGVNADNIFAVVLSVNLAPLADGSYALAPSLVNSAALAGLQMGLAFAMLDAPDQGEDPVTFEVRSVASQVPEPSTLLLLSAGIASMVAARRRRAS